MSGRSTPCWGPDPFPSQTARFPTEHISSLCLIADRTEHNLGDGNIDVPDDPGKGDPIGIDGAEADTIAGFIAETHSLDDPPDVTALEFAPDGHRWREHLIVRTETRPYGVRLLKHVTDGPLASDILEACQVPGYMRYETAACPEIFDDLLGEETVVYPWLPGDPRDLDDDAVIEDIKQNEVQFLRDLGAWVCVEPVVRFTDISKDNFVWDLEDKVFCRIDYESAFDGPKGIQSALTVLRWFEPDIEVDPATIDPSLLDDADQDGPDDAPGSRAFVQSVERVHSRLEWTSDAWFGDLSAKIDQDKADEIHRWIEKDLEGKLSHIRDVLEQGAS